MNIYQGTRQLMEERANVERSNRSVGLVPTMGYLHRGHLKLVEQSLAENDVTVVSIFVNPTQFGPGEDFGRYPRDLERDKRLLEEQGVDIVFFPSAGELYPEGYLTYVEVESLGGVLCGASRPGHFRGVVTIVLKLFNIVRPHRAYFGRKDAQQAVIIKKMARDLHVPVDIRTIPILRDEDGLALSSRNSYLSEEERAAALHLPGALEEARKRIAGGSRDAAELKRLIRERVTRSPLVKTDYVEIVSLDRLQPLGTVDMSNTLAAAAIWAGNTRLIDNFILGEL
jgi:pantoate--beta-alanine ligase